MINGSAHEKLQIDPTFCPLLHVAFKNSDSGKMEEHSTKNNKIC